jgi:hypothetical protein
MTTIVDRIDEAMGKLLGVPANSPTAEALRILGLVVPELQTMAGDLHRAHLDLIERYGTPGYAHALEVIQDAEIKLAGDQTR